MKTVTTIATLLALAIPAAAQAGNVRVDLSGVHAGGTLYVQLQTRAQFLGAERSAGDRIVAPQAGTLSVDLGEVPPGDYAVTVWHDDNGNQQFDIDPRTGRPLDGLAMAPVAGLRGPPTFDQLKVTIPAAGLAVPLAMHYSR
ncbi:MAG: hypothetical protein QOH47_2339 [Sphingomonadales bacterium]|jgi:uncharacterized protein (DUF2141 family)|nr:hypothetical protein [Sphingomonadales bacterium]